MQEVKEHRKENYPEQYTNQVLEVKIGDSSLLDSIFKIQVDRKEWGNFLKYVGCGNTPINYF